VTPPGIGARQARPLRVTMGRPPRALREADRTNPSPAPLPPSLSRDAAPHTKPAARSEQADSGSPRVAGTAPHPRALVLHPPPPWSSAQIAAYPSTHGRRPARPQPAQHLSRRDLLGVCAIVQVQAAEVNPHAAEITVAPWVLTPGVPEDAVRTTFPVTTAGGWTSVDFYWTADRDDAEMYLLIDAQGTALSMQQVLIDEIAATSVRTPRPSARSSAVTGRRRPRASSPGAPAPTPTGHRAS
jgi:hypothetical protein